MNYQDSKQYEIMAPVGSYESLAAAIEAGADSVYFGVGQLNMRSHSANHFDIGDLRQIVAICTEHGIKTYLTVNTIIYDNDLATMREILDAAREACVSAIIASDVAVMSYCRKIGLEVHLSTQLNISNVEALRFYAQFADVPYWRASSIWIRSATSTRPSMVPSPSSVLRASPSASRCSAMVRSAWPSRASAT